MIDLHEQLELDTNEEIFLAEDHDPQQLYRALTNALDQIEQWAISEAA